MLFYDRYMFYSKSCLDDLHDHKTDRYSNITICWSENNLFANGWFFVTPLSSLVSCVFISNLTMLYLCRSALANSIAHRCRDNSRIVGEYTNCCFARYRRIFRNLFVGYVSTTTVIVSNLSVRKS